MKKKYNRKKSFNKRQQKWRSARNISTAKSRRGLSLNFFSIKGKIISSIILVLILGFLYFIFLSPFFQIQNVIIDHEGVISAEEIEKVYNSSDVQSGFMKSNILLFSSQDMKQHLLDQIPLLSSVAIDKEFPNIIRVRAAEKLPKVILKTKNSTALVSSEGEAVLMLSEDQENIPDLPVVVVDQEKEIQIGDDVTSPKIIRFIEVLTEDFPAKTSFEIERFEVPTLFASEIHVITTSNFKAMLTIDHSVESQLINLASVIQQEIGLENVENIEYIDLRVGSWVYYK